jgi:AraC-like DNA-binding protein
MHVNKARCSGFAFLICMLYNVEYLQTGNKMNQIAPASKAKTTQAIDYLRAHEAEGVTVYAAAKKFGISPAAVYRKIKNLEETAQSRCKCCGQIVKGND